MFVLLVIYLSFAAAFWLLSFVTDSFVFALAILATIQLLFVAVARDGGGNLVSNATRCARFAQFVQSFFRVSVDSRSIANVIANRDECGKAAQVIYACEPHGAMCLHLTCVFAGYGNNLPRDIGDNVRVVAHWVILWIPFVNLLLAVYGVIGSNRGSVEAALDEGHSIAMIPSAISGKEHALLDRYAEPERQTHHLRVYRQKNKFGFLALAIRRGLPVVPVLSPNEASNAYVLWNQQWRAWPLVILIGRNIIAPLLPIPVLIGQPIETTRFRQVDNATNVSALAVEFYTAMSSLANQAGYAIEYRSIDDME